MKVLNVHNVSEQALPQSDCGPRIVDLPIPQAFSDAEAGFRVPTLDSKTARDTYNYLGVDVRNWPGYDSA